MSIAPVKSLETPALSDAELDIVAGGVRGIDPQRAQISTMLLNGVLDPWWVIVGQTGHLPTTPAPR